MDIIINTKIYLENQISETLTEKASSMWYDPDLILFNKHQLMMVSYYRAHVCSQ